MPVFDGERFLDEALAAVCAQDADGLEILVSDNGSTDASLEIARDWAARDSRVRVLVSDVNRGGTWNFNRLLEAARAPLFKWAPADDVIAPSFVSRCIETLSAEPLAVAVLPRTVYIDEAGAVIEERQDLELGLDAPSPHERLDRLLSGMVAHVMYGLLGTETLRAIGGVRRGPGADWAIGAQLCMLGKIVLVPEQLMMQRRHGGQSNGSGAEIVAWDNPGATGRTVSFGLANLSINAALASAVRSVRLPLDERTRCAATVLRTWTLPRLPGALATDVFDMVGATWPPDWVRRWRAARARRALPVGADG
ncbi:glycosyltransferase family 2 protein [Isoptericola sp. NPDC019482]|uniref:glycosyltransferase family 2 protein n=1 Tax=Isoptericola sp. NPDC019482 TaxID=3154688 RepID=UPI00348FB17A